MKQRGKTGSKTASTPDVAQVDASKSRSKDAKTASARDTRKALDASRPKRDTFRMPRREFEALRALKRRARGLGATAKKSELLRAGLRLLAACDDRTLRDALAALTRAA